MSRPKRARIHPEAAAVPPAVASVASDDADELHRRAVELREYRMGRGARPAGFETPVVRTTEAGTTAVTFPVLGMTCRTCEVRIAKHVERLPNVERVTASAVRGEVTVECAVPVSAAAIEQAINKAGYEIGRTPWLARDAKVWGTAGAGLLLVAAVAVIAQVTGAGDLASGAGELSSGGLLVALLLGLAAGVSTCMAMVGGLVLGLSASFTARRAARGEEAGAATALRPALVLVGGRIAGYARVRCGARRRRREPHDAATPDRRADDRGRARDDDPRHASHGAVPPDRGLVAHAADGPRLKARPWG